VPKTRAPKREAVSPEAPTPSQKQSPPTDGDGPAAIGRRGISFAVVKLAPPGNCRAALSHRLLE
jgi:hypothetical protein